MPAFCAKMPAESFVGIAIYSVPLHLSKVCMRLQYYK